jgi:hypothetical protein
MVDKVQKFWHRYSGMFHILTLIISLSVTWGIVQTSVANQGEEIAKLRTKHDALSSDLAAIRTDTAVTKQQVTDIKESIADLKIAFNIPTRHKNER